MVKSWAVALAVNLVLFGVLATTARFRVYFEFVETERRTPVVIMSKAEFEALRARRTSPPPADTNQERPSDKPSQPSDLLPEPERETTEIPTDINEETDKEWVSEAQPDIDAPEISAEPDQAGPDQTEADESEEDDTTRLSEPDFSKIDYVKPPPKAVASDPYAGLTGEQIDELYKQQAAARRRLQAQRAGLVDLPEGEASATGVIAIHCYELFTDQDKAAECAGRDILSGWQAQAGQFDGIAQSMRQGDAGPETPFGPSARVPLKDNEEYYGRSKVPQILLGPKLAKELKDAAAIEDLKDPRRATNAPTTTGSGYDSMGLDDPIPTSSNGFVPSWVLRDDPDLDLEDIERIMRDAERDRVEKVKQ